MSKLIKRNPDPFYGLFNNFLDDISWALPGALTRTKYSHDKDDKGNLLLEIDLPGFDKEQVKVTLERGYLNVKAEGEKRNTSTYFYIGEGYDFVKAVAKLDKGVLNITLPPMPEDATNPRTILVQGPSWSSRLAPTQPPVT